MKRKGYRFEYYAVREWNERGDLLHLHIVLISGYINVNHIRQAWDAIHQAHILKIQPITNFKQLKSYLFKYLIKNIVLFQRGFWYSKGWMPSGWRTAWKRLWSYAIGKMSYLNLISISNVYVLWEIWLLLKGWKKEVIISDG